LLASACRRRHRCRLRDDSDRSWHLRHV